MVEPGLCVPVWDEPVPLLSELELAQEVQPPLPGIHTPEEHAAGQLGSSITPPTTTRVW
jgi:hypothetical protein